MRTRRTLRPRLPRLGPYALACVLIATVLCIRLGADPWVGDHPMPTMLLPPVLLCAYFGGIGPGIFATGVAAFGVDYFVIQPRHSLEIAQAGDLFAWIGLLVSGVLASVLLGTMRRAGERERPQRKSAIEWKVQIVFGVALGCLVAVGALSYYSMGQMTENIAASRHAETMVDAIKSVMAHVRDVETMTGRFVITGAESQLEPFDAGVADVAADLANLRTLLSSEPQQRERFERLSRLVERRIAIAREVIALRRRDAALAQAAIGSGEGKRVVDSLRTVSQQMEQLEDDVGKERDRRSTDYGRITRATVLLGGALASLFLLAAMFVIHRDFAGRRRADAALRQANDLLETRVRERTDALRESHEALREREAQLDAIVASALDAIVTVDPAGRILVFNAAAERMFGRPASQLRGQSIDGVIPGFHATFGGRTDCARRAAMIAEHAPHQALGLRADGSAFPLEASVSKVDLAGPALLTAILRDVTERRRAEAALRAGELQLRRIIDALPALIAHVGGDRTYRYANQAYAEWWGRTRDTVIGRRIDEILGSDACAAAEGDFDAAFAGRVTHFEHAMLRAGEQRSLVGTLVPEVDAAGQPVGAFVLINDVTEQRRVMALLQRTEKMDALGTLAGGIAHDFNNVLPAIRGFARMAMEELPPDHLTQKTLAEIDKAARRASDLVRRILAFSRPQERRTERIQLEAAIDEALSLVRATLPAMIGIRTELARDLPRVRADPTEIHQVIVNLLTNAAHAMGGRVGVIDLRLEQVGIDDSYGFAPLGLVAGPYLRLTIADEGCGMDAATQARIFDPFFTTKPSGQGTGLGLSIVHGIMKSAGGAITVRSELGKGTQFFLYFPVDGSLAPEGVSQEPPVPRGDGKHLLYVDDEEALVFLVKRFLERLGYRVTGFSSAQDALTDFLAHPSHYDAVVTDLAMPGMSGIDLVRAILGTRPDIPTILTSGHLRPEDERTARQCGVQAFVCKPTSMDEYAHVLARLFRERTVPVPSA